MNLEDYESRQGKSRHTEVKINCEQCGNEKWVRWIRVKKGQGRFCSLECANLFQRKWGRENVYFYFDKAKGRWLARWRDDESGKTRISHRSHFVWESIYGEIPDEFDIHHIDGDRTNDDLTNSELVEGHLHRQDIHGSIRKVIGNAVYKQCYKCKKFFLESEFTQSYCKLCHAEYMREYRSKLK